MKKITLLFWLLFIAALTGFVPDSASLWIKIVGVMLLLAHAIEFILFEKTIKAKGDSGIKSFLMTMVYGIFYFKF